MLVGVDTGALRKDDDMPALRLRPIAAAQQRRASPPHRPRDRPRSSRRANTSAKQRNFGQFLLHHETRRRQHRDPEQDVERRLMARGDQHRSRRQILPPDTCTRMPQMARAARDLQSGPKLRPTHDLARSHQRDQRRGGTVSTKVLPKKNRLNSADRSTSSGRSGSQRRSHNGEAVKPGQCRQIFVILADQPPYARRHGSVPRRECPTG